MFYFNFFFNMCNWEKSVPAQEQEKVKKNYAIENILQQ